MSKKICLLYLSQPHPLPKELVRKHLKTTAIINFKPDISTPNLLLICNFLYPKSSLTFCVEHVNKILKICQVFF